MAKRKQPTFTLPANDWLKFIPVDMLLAMLPGVLGEYLAGTLKNLNSPKARTTVKAVRALYATLGAFLAEVDRRTTPTACRR